MHGQHLTNHCDHVYWTTSSAVSPNTDTALEYKQLKLEPQIVQRVEGCSKEIGRLSREEFPKMMTESNTIHFIYPSEKPSDRKATYLGIVASFHPQRRYVGFFSLL